jgi:ribosome-associated translation inhibitor RaiA
MNLDFRLRGWKNSSALRHLVQTQLDRLHQFVSVSGAEVVLERRRAATPAWVARAHLQVPGPDLRAEACDHTVEAAWRKVMQELYGQVGRRLERRRGRPDATRRLRPALRFQ